MSHTEEPGSWFYTLKQIFEIFDMKWSGIKLEKHVQRKLLENMRMGYEEYLTNSTGKQGDGSGKISTYRDIKTGVRKIPWLYQNLSIKISSNKIQNKCPLPGNRDISIQQKTIPRNERFCSSCILDRFIHIGDEFHAMMVCNEFKQSRSEIFEMFRQECEELIKWEYMKNAFISSHRKAR